MYRLLVVDDEVEIVDWLVELFDDCKELDLDIYKAYSGDEALELLNKARMDIVLSDIRMPGINGLQLLEHIHGNWPQCRVIFLTGYNEFDYIYTAIQYEGISYLLKTEEDEVIIGAVEKAIGDIQKGARNQELIDLARHQLEIALPVLQKEFLLSLLNGEINSLQIGQQRLDELHLQLRAEYPFLLVLGQFTGDIGNMSITQITEKAYELDILTWRQLSEKFKSVFLAIGRFNFVWLIQPMESTLKTNRNSETYTMLIKETLAAVQTIYRDHCNISASFILSEEYVTWDDIAEKYDQLKHQLNTAIAFENEIILTEKSMLNRITPDSDNGKYGRKIQNQLKSIEALGSYLERGQKHEFLNALNHLSVLIENVKSMNSSVALQVFYSLSMMFLNHINRWSLSDQIPFRPGLDKLTRSDSFNNWGEAFAYFQHLADVIFELQESEQNEKVNHMISRIEQYVEDNLSGDLSLVKLAEIVHFNPSYLSRIFKRMTGSNLSDYINDVRNQRAKRLLEEGDLKIHEIAELVGFESSHYFARFFRKATNMTPQEYREFSMKNIRKPNK